MYETSDDDFCNCDALAEYVCRICKEAICVEHISETYDDECEWCEDIENTSKNYEKKQEKAKNV